MRVEPNAGFAASQVSRHHAEVRNNDSIERVPLPALPRGRHVYSLQRDEDANKLTVVSISSEVLYFLGVSYRSSGCNEFISTPPYSPSIRFARGAYIYAYAYICTLLPSAFVTFSFSHKAPIRVHLQAKTLPRSFFSPYYFALFPLDEQPQANQGKKSAIHIPRSRFIPTVTDIVEEGRNNRARTDRDECGGWCQGGKNIQGRTGSKKVK